MAIGAARRVSFVKEPHNKWGAFFTTVKTAASSSATTLVVNGSGGKWFGAPTVVAGMYVWFMNDLTEAPKLITAVSVDGATPPNATLTIAALANSRAVGDKVVIGYKPSTAFLPDTFTVKRNLNNWSTFPFAGVRAKNVGRKIGRIEVTGSLGFQLRPDVNNTALVRAIGQDMNVTGTVPGTPVNSTLSALTNVGDTTFTSASACVIGDIVQIGVGTLAECRKITNKVTTTFTVDAPLDFAHANADPVNKVVAPFLHTIPSSNANLDSVTIEDYIAFDDESQSSGLATTSYLVPGVLAKGLKIESNSEHGVNCTVDYEAQDRVKIVASSAVTIPSEDPFSYSAEAVLFDGTRNYRVEEVHLDLNNNPQKRYSKKGDNRLFALKAGEQEVTGSLKIYENADTQLYFWDRNNSNTPIAFLWTVTDPTTQYYVQLSIPQLVTDAYDDSEFSPSDLVDVTIPFAAKLDAGATNVQLTLTISNGQWLPY